MHRAFRFYFALSMVSACQSAPIPAVVEIPVSEPPPRPAAAMPSEPTPAAVAAPAAKPGVLPPIGRNDENLLYFEPGATEVDARGQRILRRHALALKKNRRSSVTMVCYTGEHGSRTFQLAICEERLDAAEQLLRARGVAKRQIHRKSLGGDRPAGLGPHIQLLRSSSGTSGR